jgi:hypothetical protein
MVDRRRMRGQTLVEFSLGIIVFLTVLTALIDLARAAYIYNGVSEAAREIARVTSLHPGSGSLGTSTETAATVATEQGIVPGLTVSSYACVDLAGSAVSGTCQPGSWVRVTVIAAFQPVLPLLAAFGPINVASVSSARIQ